MICACTHRNCWFIFAINGGSMPERCPDCGKPMVRPATPEEIAWCTGSQGDKAQSYAARFAAKEAFLKAIGTGLRGGGQLTEISVINDELGKPELKVTGCYAAFTEKLGVKKIHLTLSHTAATAMAVVVLE